MLFALFSLLSLAVYGQSQPALVCTASSLPGVVRQEGLAERVSDVSLICSGGQPGSRVQINLTILLSTNITNAVAKDGAADVKLSIDNGAGPVYIGVDPTPSGPNSVTYYGLAFNLSSSASAVLRLSNIRAAAGAMPLGLDSRIQAFFTANGSHALSVNNNPVTVAIAQPGLLATFPAQFLCTGSSLPVIIDFLDVLNFGTRFRSVRFTAGFAGSLQRGTRLFVRFTGFPPGARLMIPDAVVGSSAPTPTSAGDMGLAVSPGSIFGFDTQFLMVRVSGADSFGAGGATTYSAPGSLSEVTMSGGSGIIIYEVTNSNALQQESAQFPVFLVMDPRPDSTALMGQIDLGFAPFSGVSSASSTAPVPRFVNGAVTSDCTALGKCSGPDIPKLAADVTEALAFTAQAGGAFQYKDVSVRNISGGRMNWTPYVTYKNGAAWIKLNPAPGTNSTSLRLFVYPENLKPGSYDATLTIDAGPLAGTASFPISIKVNEVILPPPPIPTLRSYMNPAAAAAGPVVAGSLASVFGQNFTGKTLEVALDGLPAKILFSNDTQINLQVPDQLAGRTSAKLIVSVDGRPSAAMDILLAASAPAIFQGVALNQDYSRNSANNPATAGSVIQLFLTGLPLTGVTASIFGRQVPLPYYAGPAPGLTGVQQVDLLVPDDLPQSTAEVRVCGLGVCTEPILVTVRL